MTSSLRPRLSSTSTHWQGLNFKFKLSRHWQLNFNLVVLRLSASHGACGAKFNIMIIMMMMILVLRVRVRLPSVHVLVLARRTTQATSSLNLNVFKSRWCSWTLQVLEPTRDYYYAGSSTYVELQVDDNLELSRLGGPELKSCFKFVSQGHTDDPWPQRLLAPPGRSGFQIEFYNVPGTVASRLWSASRSLDTWRRVRRSLPGRAYKFNGDTDYTKYAERKAVEREYYRTMFIS